VLEERGLRNRAWFGGKVVAGRSRVGQKAFSEVIEAELMVIDRQIEDLGVGVSSSETAVRARDNPPCEPGSKRMFKYCRCGCE
jgi:hypothetical protein